MAILSAKDISMSFGGPALLDQANLQIQPGERICLVGRNGEGKSTLLGILEGTIRPDEGTISCSKDTRITSLVQNVPGDINETVFDIVANGLSKWGEKIRQYHALNNELAHPDADTQRLLKRLDILQTELENSGGWQMHQEIETVISRVNLNPEDNFSKLSGGQKRRALLARALAGNPDLLLLDEPTNHLDIDTINWMEDFLKRSSITILFVTHDRVFLKKLATRIVELDRGKLHSWNCDYNTYLKRKAELLEAEESANQAFDKKLAQEEVWIRKGIRARRTRNEGRVRELEKMRQLRRDRRGIQGPANLQIQNMDKSGQKVIEAKGITYSWDKTPIVKNFSTTVLRGDKVGIIGPNGSGKTTLINILLGKLPAQGGTVKHGTNLQVAYFDQLRHQLDEKLTVAQNISPHSDTIKFNGQIKHVYTYLQDFLFAPDRARTPVKALSGGERNRLMLAKLFTRPANLLVLDEPTNDLDVETLELLEELLGQYQGTIILVSHDREFLNNVVTSTIAFEENAELFEYAGGYDDWVIQRQNRLAVAAQQMPQQEEEQQTQTSKQSHAKANRKLTNNERKELAKLPALIEKLENEQAQLEQLIQDPDFYKKPQEEIKQANQRLADLPQELEQAFARWEKLDECGK